MTLPHFLCIGAQKAGTSWLFAQLQSHPRVWMPPVKELQYFNHLYVPAHRNWTRWHIRQGVSRALKFHVGREASPNLEYVRYLATMATGKMFTDEWYAHAFDRPAARQKVVGDVTPEYCAIPEEGIGHVRALLGQVKIIYLIRRPLSRTLSQLRMHMLRSGMTEPSVAQWEAMLTQLDWDIVNRGDYQTYVPRWKAHFAPQDLLFLPYGRLSHDPDGVMRDVEAFLGLPPHIYVKARERVHETGRLDVPDWVTERIAARIDGQDAFLEAEFGREFMELV